MFIGFYEIINLIFAYLYHEENDDKAALKLSGVFLSVFGVIGMFLMLGFQDYNRFQNSIDDGVDPFEKAIGDIDVNDLNDDLQDVTEDSKLL